MLEEASNHSIADIENSIKNSLLIKREDDDNNDICKHLCKTFCLCVICFLLIIALVIFFVKVILQ